MCYLHFIQSKVIYVKMAAAEVFITEKQQQNFEETDLTVLGYHNDTPEITTARRLPPHGGKTRKRKSAPKTWSQNMRKQLRQPGQPYKNRKGENVPCMSVTKKKDCLNSCKFRCAQNISDEERTRIFADFWSMDDMQKRHFYSRTTERLQKKRHRTINENSRKAYSFYYSFFVGDWQTRVCKEFYLTTLNISSRRVYYYHEKKNDTTGSPALSK
ncbi:uncharacterized protein LOC124807374 [Hydra vulgaris]|uniref:uncharacterized protein LOC124807374 n=1 Tax=Hydra vulgaris TaxID=6087 RepID=UPI001F5F0710|nr:uncharacterized protein LOC124807374 [Hydra vulgaris]